MNEQTLLVTALSVAGAALVTSLACAFATLAARARMRSAASLADALKEGFVEKTVELKSLAKRNDDLARRVAWLESRGVSRPEPEPAPEEAESPRRLTITERRHRVLSLSRKGQDSGTIASLLGIPVGEVELIIGLNRAA